MDFKIRMVVASRLPEEYFPTHTALGQSLEIYRYPFVEVDLYAANQRSLPEVYNESIERAQKDPAILVFAHDDIYLTEFFWPDRIWAGLEMFDLCGVAGNTRRLPKQPSWAFISEQGHWDEGQYLSGLVAHGNGFPQTHLSVFGRPLQEVKLLDGVLLAAHSHLLNTKGLKFDPRFDFHCYDMDFCRSAEQLGLRMGTIPLSLVHQSVGAFFTPDWNENFSRYLTKWGE